MGLRGSIQSREFLLEHDLKIWPQYYACVADGSKTFEVRDNDDRNFQKGDTVILREWDPKPLPGVKTSRGYTESKPLKFKIGYVYNLSSSRVVFSLLPLPVNKKSKITKIY